MSGFGRKRLEIIDERDFAALVDEALSELRELAAETLKQRRRRSRSGTIERLGRHSTKAGADVMTSLQQIKRQNSLPRIQA
jgi:hypothetical protein